MLETFFLIAPALIAVVFADITNNREFIQLHLGEFVGNVTSSEPLTPESFEIVRRRLPDETYVLCGHVQLIGDIVCDVTDLGAAPQQFLINGTGSISFVYRHPLESNTTCYADLRNDDERITPEYFFTGGSCSGDVGDEFQPEFNIHSVTGLEMNTISVQGPTKRCEVYFNVHDDVTEGVIGSENRIKAFKMSGMFCPTSLIAGGVTAGRRVVNTFFKIDGRRIRPS